MNMKTLLKALSFICLSSLALAKNDCRTLTKTYNLVKGEEIITDCSTNSNGEIVSLNLYNSLDLTEKDLDKILSHSTLNNLVFTEDYGNCEPLVSRISGLSNLEELIIQSYKGHIEKGVLKGLNKLRKLTIQYTYLSNENLKEIVALPNLKELVFYNPEFESNISFTPLKKASNIQSVTIEGNIEYKLTNGLIKNLKKIKKLTIKDLVVTQSLFNEITSLSNLNELSFKLFSSKKDFKVTSFDSVKNLTKLTALEINSDFSEVPEFVYSIPNLRKLTFNNREIKLY
ncbi:hypothetical protein LY90DRAFT_501454 [Neocallimastix californiae]|uniref:RNI-like protein n=1 Tax=Neocallimastix californiae TaxID=1754190 RepID=A0A1Y2EZR4_9FUNG|nr:hypothetical protein LY90DRAFT_501454 [Neocallimastix californiae]|eukprot:ORY77073.1 hypothetical protein LY90DRAFT_501454 [Neocallimastix californiae]